MPQPSNEPTELNVALMQLDDLETTILDASPEELADLHSKLIALVTDLPDAIKQLLASEKRELLLEIKIAVNEQAERYAPDTSEFDPILEAINKKLEAEKEKL